MLFSSDVSSFFLRYRHFIVKSPKSKMISCDNSQLQRPNTCRPLLGSRSIRLPLCCHPLPSLCIMMADVDALSPRYEGLVRQYRCYTPPNYLLLTELAVLPPTMPPPSLAKQPSAQHLLPPLMLLVPPATHSPPLLLPMSLIL